MDQVITFDKSLQQRLREYKDVLSGYEVLPASAVAREWGFYLELTMDPCGWQAIWKIPRITCEKLKIPFPSIVLIFVIRTDLKELSAQVHVLAVQDDIQIPKKHIVPLMQLWPTREQDDTIALSINNTANALDMLRFFYTNVFMPWDREDSDSTDWLSKHLESRLRLYYDVKNSVVPKPIAEHYFSLLSEARRIQSKREMIESKLVESVVDVYENSECEDVHKLIALNIRMMKIKCGVKMLENPVLRAAVIRQQKELDEKASNVEQQVWLIHSEAKIKDVLEFSDNVKVYFPEAAVEFSSDLASSSEIGNPNDIFVLNSEKHSLRTVMTLEDGAVLKGIRDKCDTIVTSSVEDIMLDFKGNILIENLTIDASSAHCAIIVRKGKVLISNCKIVGSGKSSTQQGIVVLAGGEIELINSEICEFAAAIVGNSGSRIKLNNVYIHHNTLGIRIFDNCTLTLNRSTFQEYRNYGICVETENCMDTDDRKVGDFSLLSTIPGVTTEDVKGENNGKGDVVINQKSKLRPVHDVFSDPELNATLCGYEEMASSENEMTVDSLENNEANVRVIYERQPESPTFDHELPGSPDTI